jgi:toxin ParE1/3/4
VIVRWTETAADDLVAIRDYIAQDSPLAAQMIAARLFDAVAVLATFPDSGRIVPERSDPALRELIRPPYRIVYERQSDIVMILTVFHAARRFPASGDEPAR